jgi:Fur family transcriptional regulator, peroxide stress response regulator
MFYPMKIEPNFRELCRQSGLAVTHQRQVVFDSLAKMPDHHHPCPEEVYAEVRKLIPSISQATVYKTLHTFVEHGILRELSPHHGTLRVDINTRAHHHLFCTRCKTVIDIDEGDLDPVKLRRRLPKGFRVDRVAVEVQGLCDECGKQTKSTRPRATSRQSRFI